MKEDFLDLTEDEDLKKKLQKIAGMVTLWYLPIIVSIGIIGNTLTLIILSTENKLQNIVNSQESFLQKFRNMKYNFANSNIISAMDVNKIKSTSTASRCDTRLIANRNVTNFKISQLKPRDQNFSSSSYFIFALASSDLIYNSILALVWISRAELYDVVNINYVCQISIAISYICGFLSAAFTLLFTFQRFMAVVQPLKAATTFSLQSKRFIRRLIAFLIGFSILTYSFSLFMYDTELKKDYELSKAVRSCGVNENYTNFVYIFDNTADSFLTLVIPSIGILIMNVTICRSFSKHQKHKSTLLNENLINSCASKSKNIKEPSSFRNQPDHSHFEINNEQNGSHLELQRLTLNKSISNYSAKSKSTLTQSRSDVSMGDVQKPTQSVASRHVTKTLLIVSFAFILLNSPYRASKLISYIRMHLTGVYVYSNLEYAVNEVLINLYFTSYSVNFFLYSLCGKKFRSSFQALVLFCLFYCYSKIVKFLNIFSKKDEK